jgi:hypothetical protein
MIAQGCGATGEFDHRELARNYLAGRLLYAALDVLPDYNMLELNHDGAPRGVPVAVRGKEKCRFTGLRPRDAMGVSPWDATRNKAPLGAISYRR